MEEYAGWIRKGDFIRELGKSERTVDRIIEQENIRKGYLKGDGRRPIPVLNPADIQHYKDSLHVLTPVVMEQTDTGAAAPHTNGALAKPESRQTAAREKQVNASELIEAAVAYLQRIKTDSQTSALRLFLSLTEASALTGLSESCLRRQIKEGKMKAVQNRGSYWIARRTLEQFDGDIVSV